jgi:glucose-fructose oxidoreductase
LGEINHPYNVPWQQAKQMDDDALAIMQSKPMQVPGEEGLRDIRIVEAIYKCANTGQRVSL